jgi:hypothetical protein
LRDRYEEFRNKHAEVSAIGMGWPEMAAGFKAQFAIPFPLLVDRDRASYAGVSIRRGSLMEVVGPKVWLPWLKSIARGTGQTLTKVDQLQLGGSLIVAPGGDVLFQHSARTAADNASVDDLLRALG